MVLEVKLVNEKIRYEDGLRFVNDKRASFVRSISIVKLQDRSYVSPVVKLLKQQIIEKDEIENKTLMLSYEFNNIIRDKDDIHCFIHVNVMGPDSVLE